MPLFIEDTYNQTSLQEEEFDRRCHNVFPKYDQSGCQKWFSAIHVGDNGRIHLAVSSIRREADGDAVVTIDYLPNMDHRPHAIDYLLGKRDDFDD